MYPELNIDLARHLVAERLRAAEHRAPRPQSRWFRRRSLRTQTYR